jgi:hypothetical protein
VAAGSGFVGALQLAEEVRRRFKAPRGGGWARDPRWTTKRLMPVRPDTLSRLEELAQQVSELVRHRVEPLQVAAVLVERDLETFSDKELVRTVARGARRAG